MVITKFKLGNIKINKIYLVLITAIILTAIIFTIEAVKFKKADKAVSKDYPANKVIKDLSQEEKIEDFNYLYKVIEENYPFLEVNKRVNNIDWEKNKELYIQRVKETENDTDFFMVLQGILNDLNNAHTSMYKVNAEEIKDLLKKKDEIDKEKHKYNWHERNTLDILQNKTFLERNNIDASNKNLDDNKSKDNGKQEARESTHGDNIIAKDIVENKVGYIRIKSFDDSSMEEDEKALNKYLEKVSDYKSLIIDIRGNRGGTDAYWKKVLFPRIINKPFSSTTYSFYRDGDISKEYLRYTYGDDLKGVGVVNKDLISKLPNLPKEVLSDFKYYETDEDEISPKASINYKGNIYLLVDKSVYSAAESLAVFCKQSKLATLVGEKTKGGANGIGPTTVMLPKSAFLFEFETALGTHLDGTCDEEFNTEPDVYVKDSSINEDLQIDNCINEVLRLEKIN
ncbi:peptidase [Clostridium sp. YIM B02505]|uniref:Peptidase n=1 Tax=Clostridium yunnanense TaxID=2800325 RepID=A0ABS1EUQ4_9CLOT|nr:S41 family peptidase [Clostridium yunnanense]MBK1813112.1 peptidase [Clostridium yunnanense]